MGFGDFFDQSEPQPDRLLSLGNRRRPLIKRLESARLVAGGEPLTRVLNDECDLTGPRLNDEPIDPAGVPLGVFQKVGYRPCDQCGVSFEP